MLQRIISGAACTAVVALVLCFYNTLALEAAICVLSAAAVFELLRANGFKEHKPFLFAGVIAAALVPYAGIFDLQMLVYVLFVAVVIILLLRYHSKVSFEKVCFLVVATMGVSFSFNCMIALRDNFKNGLFMILVVFGGAWFSDTGAYFAGRFFGKHKMSPQISPKKTIEGAIGGVITNIGLLCLIAFIYQKICSAYNMQVDISYIWISVSAVVLTLASMAGDLIASVIKRQIGIKDYGKLIPGHGGIMDRFDSILLTAPALYVMSSFVKFIN